MCVCIRIRTNNDDKEKTKLIYKQFVQQEKYMLSHSIQKKKIIIWNEPKKKTMKMRKKMIKMAYKNKQRLIYTALYTYYYYYYCTLNGVYSSKACSYLFSKVAPRHQRTRTKKCMYKKKKTA